MPLRCPKCNRVQADGAFCPYDATPLVADAPVPDAAAAPPASEPPPPEDATKLLPPRPDSTPHTVPLGDSDRMRRTPSRPRPELTPGPRRAGPPALEPGDVIEGRFVIRKDLGAGGFGSTFVCDDDKFRRKAVVKILHAVHANDAETRRRFELEALALSRIAHRNVVQVFDRGETHDGIPWFAMEFVEGTVVSSMLKAGPLPEAQVCEIGMQLCEALQAAHLKGFVHRDLKPDNLILTTAELGRPLLKVLDFGVAAVALENGPDTAVRDLRSVALGSIIGTVAYMSPEQARGEKVTPLSDLYSAGVVLYQLLTGLLPAVLPPQWTLPAIEAYVSAKPMSIARVRPGATPAVASAVLRALEKDPARRYRDAAEMGDALRAAREVLERGRRPRRAVAPAVAGIALLLCAGLLALFLRSEGTAPGVRTAPAPGESPAAKHEPAPATPIAPAPPEAPPQAVPTEAAPQPGPPAQPAVAAGPAAPAPAKAEPAPPGTGAKPAARSEPAVPAPAASAFVEDMIALPALTASLGCSGDGCADDERPLQTRVGAFRLDRNEVTLADYLGCASAGACAPPATAPRCLPLSPDDRRPVNCVTWAQADAYCRWRGARLPTEFEWERAASGGGVRPYPWGDAEPDCTRATMRGDDDLPGCGANGPAPVSSRVFGRTPEGIADLAGNLWEWTADWYGEQTYRDGRPPQSGRTRVVRGGCFESSAGKLASHFRMNFDPQKTFPTVGFRCAK